MAQIAELLVGCLKCQEPRNPFGVNGRRARLCYLCGSELAAGAICWKCTRFQAADKVDSGGLCESCRENGK